jgi:hypothetical protein
VTTGKNGPPRERSMPNGSNNRTRDRRAMGGRLKVPEGSERALGALGRAHLQQLSLPDTPQNSALTGSIPVSATMPSVFIPITYSV